MSLSKQEFTNAGRAMLGRAQNGEVLTISSIVVGDGEANSVDELWPLTVLINKVMDVTMSTKRDYGDGTMLVEGSFVSSEAPRAFYLKEVGVMAHIGAEGPRLYSVANVLLDPPDYVDPESPTIQAFKIKLVIDRIPTDSLIVQIGASENVIGENIGSDTVGPGPYKEAAGNVVRFKRFAADPGIALREDADENIIYIGASQLTTNVDLYVPENHPQCPDPEVGFPTIQAAHDYLLQFRIPSDKIATIHVYRGTFQVSSPILFSHPDSKQITVRGEPRDDRAIASIQYISPTIKRLVIADTGDLTVNLHGYVWNSAPAWAGGCRITSSPHPLNVEVTIEKRDSQGNYTDTDSGREREFRFFPTVVDGTQIPAGVNPVFNCPNGIRSIENICALGGWASFNLAAGILKNVMGWGATRGVNGSGPISLQSDCVFTQCDFGLTCTDVLAAYEVAGVPFALFVNACTQGIVPSGSGFAIGTITSGMDNTIVYLSRNVYAVNNAYGGLLQGGSIWFSHNDYGFRASGHSTILLGAAYASIPEENGIDLYAQGLSYIEYQRHGAVAPSCNPPAEQVGNQGALIHVLA